MDTAARRCCRKQDQHTQQLQPLSHQCFVLIPEYLWKLCLSVALPHPKGGVLAVIRALCNGNYVFICCEET